MIDVILFVGMFIIGWKFGDLIWAWIRAKIRELNSK